ncbi:unnamed protein product [Moneuplotes crassus]|uniref:Uncharacterized protein n=1 Tax=Euplotes crassus TaxID=5936 RepID=A0AAD1XJX0_EUPCR|nr:unnamed protein product [Moneuplotes crassus]
MVQKLEADVRQHIRVEQQLKLHIENIQEKSDEDAKVIDKMDREKQRHRRELKRMDEMLTIREEEITKLEKQVQDLSHKLDRATAKYEKSQEELGNTKRKLEKEKENLENERKTYSLIARSKGEARNFSRSNERSDSKPNYHNGAQTTVLQKKTVSKLYSSLYNSNKSREKLDKNSREEYDKVYQEFLKSKRGEAPQEFIESQRESNNAHVFNSSTKESGTKDIFTNNSSQKCYTKRKSNTNNSRLLNLSKSNKRTEKNYSRSKERNFESKLDFYRNKGFDCKDTLLGHKTYDEHDKENQHQVDQNIISERERNKTRKTFRIISDEYDEVSSSSPEASNEHKDADIDIEGDMDQKMMNVNMMGIANKTRGSKDHDTAYNHAKSALQYYRSKSEGKEGHIESRNHQKSHISSPNEVSSSTFKNTSTVPTTIQSETACATTEKETISCIKNRKKAIKKHYCKKSSIEKTSEHNESSKKFSRLNVKSSKRIRKNFDSSHHDSQNNPNFIDNMNQKSISNLIKKSGMIGASSESRTNCRGMNLHAVKSRPSQGVMHGSSMHNNSNFDNSISKLKNCNLNSSSSTALLRTNCNIINIKNAKQGRSKYESVSKFTKRSMKKESSDHAKTFSIVKDMVRVNRF